mgnify:CR=1 FL=1
MNLIGGNHSFRYFKIISVNYKKIKDEGRYKTKGSPGDAAKKAFTQLTKKHKTNKLIFSIKETTQGSSKKTYGPYLGEKIKLKKTLEIIFNGNPVKIKYEPKVHLVKDHKQKGGKGASYDMLQGLEYEDYQRIISELYTNSKEYEVSSFNKKTTNNSYIQAGFQITRLNAPGLGSVGIFINQEDSDTIIKVIKCPESVERRPKCKTKFFIEETYWMVNLYKIGLSPEFISLDFIKLKLGDVVDIHCLVKLRKHKTFKEYYYETYTPDLNIKDTIMADGTIKAMFTQLLDKCNDLKYHVMYDFHLNNVVMNHDDTGILLIDTIPIPITDEDNRYGDNTLEEISYKFS